MQVPTDALPKMTAVVEIEPGTVIQHEDGRFYLVAEDIVQTHPDSERVGRKPYLVDLEQGLICPPTGLGHPFPNATIKL